MLKLALRPTIPARERYYADPRASAPRQRTLEANGIDCGASVLRSGSSRRLRRCSIRAKAALIDVVARAPRGGLAHSVPSE